MTKFITSRYYLHLLVGLAIGYNATSITDFYKYPIEGKMAGVVAITLITICIAFFWEWLQSKFFEGKTDFNDVRWSAFGGLIGSILCFIFWSNDYIFYGNILLILLLVGKDIYNRLK